MAWHDWHNDWWQGHGNQHSWHSWSDNDDGCGNWDWSQRHYESQASWQSTQPTSSTWTWSAPGSESSQLEAESVGKWWDTPQGQFWGNSLDEAIEWAMAKGRISVDKAFCLWWSSQTGSDTSLCVGDSQADLGQHPQDLLDPPDGDGESEKIDSTGGKVRYGKDSIPEFDGSTTMREYRRRVKLFESVTSISPQFRAGRLLERLSGLAWKAAETLDIESIKKENGVATLLDHLEAELEPLEYMKTFQVLSHFYSHFKRQRGEQMSTYDTNFRIQCEKLREVGSALEGTAKAWRFLQKAGISDETRQKVVSAAGGEYDYLRLRQALVAIIPDVNRGDASKNADSSSAPQHGNGRKWQNVRKVTTAHRVNAVAEAAEDGLEDGDADDCELSEAGELEREAEILMTHAARKRAETEKARGFSAPKKSKESAEERQKRIQELKQKLPCSACKAKGVVAYGHWHSDASCPQNKDKPNNTFVTSTEQADSEESEVDGVIEAFAVELSGHDVQVLMQTARLRKESTGLALSDTCCARSVAGRQWMLEHLKYLKASGVPFWCMREREPFRFGVGPRTYSQWAVYFPLQLQQVEPNTQKEVWIRCSVVEDDVPFLLSRPAMKLMGAIVNLGSSEITLAASLSLPLLTTSMGLVGFEIVDQKATCHIDAKGIDFEDFEVAKNDIGETIHEVEILSPSCPEHHDQGPREKYMLRRPCTRWERVSHRKSPEFDVDHVTSSFSRVTVGTQTCIASNSPSTAFIGSRAFASLRSFLVSCNVDLRASAASKGRVCGGIASTHSIDACSADRTSCGPTEEHLDLSQASQEGVSSATKLEKGRQVVPSAALPGECDRVLPQGARRPLVDLEPCSVDSRARLVSDRSARTDGRPRSSGRSSFVSRLRDSYDRAYQSARWLFVLWLSTFPFLSKHSPNDFRHPTSGSCSKGAEGKRAPAIRKVEGEEQCRIRFRLQDCHAGRWSRKNEWACFASSCAPQEDGRGQFRVGSNGQSRSKEEDGGADSGRDRSLEGSQEEGSCGARSEAVIREPALIREAIAIRKRNLKRAKLGWCRRLLGNCRSAACASILLTATAMSSVCGGLNSVITGCDRPDALEVFGETADVTLTFSKWGWWSMEPVDLLCGRDFSDTSQRQQLLDDIDRYKPRLVVVSCPSDLYSKSNLNCRSTQDKRKLQKRRQIQRPFLELCSDIFDRQLKRGDDALGESLIGSSHFSESPIEKLLVDNRIFVGVGDGCRHGTKYGKAKSLLRKPTLWFSTSREICQELSRNCDGNRLTAAPLTGPDSKLYAKQVAAASHRGFVRTVKRKEPSRIRALLRMCNSAFLNQKFLSGLPKSLAKSQPNG